MKRVSKPGETLDSDSNTKADSAESLTTSKKDGKRSSSDTKLKEINDRERDLIIVELRNELMSNVIDICYEKYMDKQIIPFTVHCTRLALNDILECYFPSRDRGDPNGIDTDKFRNDVEPETLPRDTWAGQSVPIFHEPADELDPTSIVIDDSSESVCTLRLQTSDPSLKGEINEECDKMPKSLDDYIQHHDQIEVKTSQPKKTSISSAGQMELRKHSVHSKQRGLSISCIEITKPLDPKEMIVMKRTARRAAQEAISAELYTPEAIKTSKLPEERIEVRFAVCHDSKGNPAGPKSAKGPPPRKKKTAVIRL